MTSLLDLDHQFERIQASLVNDYEGVFTPDEVREAYATAREHIQPQATVEEFLPILSERMARHLLTAKGQAEGRLTKPLPEVLFASERNSARSHMAAALMRVLSEGKVNVRCAGTHPRGGLDPLAVQVLAERDIKIQEPYPLPFSTSLADAADYVVVLGSHDFHSYPGITWLEWEVDSLDGEGLEGAREVRDQLEERVRELLTQIEASGHFAA
ncbi:low molecular weight phosphatase family protein [Enemella sp. A6]|uniref:arsenate-mycothiol transferase ArsC n=1 Tax=Enemella sp. A6 TaxID=3440152 RepID=UPI003EBF6C0E